MKNKVILLISLLMLLIGSTMVFATEQPSNEDLVTEQPSAVPGVNPKPKEDKSEEVEFPEEDRVYLDEGVWMEDDVIVVDVGDFDSSQYEVEYSENYMETYATEMPTKVWSWSNGNYYSTYSTSTLEAGGGTYTQYLFTGSSTYYVEVQGIRDNHNSGLYNYEVQLMSEFGRYGTIETVYKVPTESVTNFKFINCQPGEKYGMKIVKAQDNSTLSGYIEVSV